MNWAAIGRGVLDTVKTIAGSFGLPGALVSKLTDLGEKAIGLADTLQPELDPAMAAELAAARSQLRSAIDAAAEAEAKALEG